MPELFELVIEAYPSSLFCNSKIYRKLFLDSLVKQGFHSCLIISDSELSCDSKNIFLKYVSKSALTENHQLFAEKITYINPGNFVSLGLKSLVRDNQACTFGLRLASENANYPYFDSKACLNKSKFFDDNWIDAYEYSGIMTCEKSIFLKVLQYTHLDQELFKSICSSCKPSTSLLGGIVVPNSASENLEKLKLYLSLPIRPCLFLDRDGIINVDTGYPHKRSQLKAIDGIIPIIQWAKNRSWWVVVVTNQAGLAKGIFKEQDYQKFSSYLQTWLTEQGVKIDAWYHCPYHPEGIREDLSFKSLKRKPHPGMILESMASLPIDVEKSLMIGDKESDILYLRGLKTLLIEGRYQLATEQNVPKVNNHERALEYLLSQD